MATILLIDDDSGIRTSFKRVLETEGHGVELARDGAEGTAVLGRVPIDLVLLDLNLPGQDGLEVLSGLRAAGQEVPVVMISGEGTVRAAVQAIQLGALDFIAKPVEAERLILSVSNALRLTAAARREAAEQHETEAQRRLIGDSPAMQTVRRLIERAAPTAARVLVRGENGTGKELVAWAIHDRSPRRQGPFVKLNCAAIPAELVESELFGHEKGAFTGAVTARRGSFELAHGGTLLLDEIGDMPREAQAKILRVLQEGELQRVGGSSVVKVDVRVLAATNRELGKLVERGDFRQDLLHRLDVLPIEVPPLRERPSDIPALLEHFLRESCRRNQRAVMSFDDDVVAALTRYHFPGNVRELGNLVERMVILGDGDRIGAAEVAAVLPLGAASAVPAAAGAPFRPGVPYRDLIRGAERAIVEGAIAHADGNLALAARNLDLERSHLYKKCRALGVARDRGDAD